MNELRIDSFCRRRVSPFDGSSSLVVVPDVTKDFSSEIVDGGKDASGDNLPLNLGEPDFDLVKPRRIGGCKMHADLGMMGQKVLITKSWKNLPFDLEDGGLRICYPIRQRLTRAYAFGMGLRAPITPRLGETAGSLPCQANRQRNQEK